MMEQNWQPPIIDLKSLEKLSSDSFGKAYLDYMRANNLSPDFYGEVAGEKEVAYLRLRVRQIHDYFHVLTGFDTTPLGEAGVIAFTYAQNRGGFGLVILAMLLLHFSFFKPHMGPQAIENILRGWKMGTESMYLNGVKLEEHLSENLDELRDRLLIPKNYGEQLLDDQSGFKNIASSQRPSLEPEITM